MIDSRSIDRVKEAADIVSVIQDCSIELKRKGSGYWAPCPFHSEKSASFSVNQTGQFFKCFGCGESGDAISFLTKHKGYQFEEAVEWLASKYNVQIEYSGVVEDQAIKDENQKGWLLLDQVKRTYHQLLMGNDQARAYMNERGFTDETLQLWQIGFAPANWRTISDMAIKQNQWDLAVKCGICVEKGDKNRDFFYNRIIIPIHDHRGNCISFGGRIWTPEQESKKEPKYLNGPDSYLYSKEQVLFGMHVAKLPMSKMKEAMLVEGYLDVIMAHQEHIQNVVAACGTSVTQQQAQSILKRASSIVLGGDADSAGEKSILKSIDLFYKLGAEKCDVLVWPEGVKDIDQYLKQSNTQHAE
jgi:DNA primase